MIKVFKEYFLIIYKQFKIILILNLLSMVPIYIFLLLAGRFLFDNIYVSRKIVAVIKDKNIEEPVKINITQRTENEIIIGISESRKIKSFFKEVNEDQSPVQENYILLTDINNTEDKIELKFNNSSIVINLKYIKKNSTVDFKINPHRGNNKVFFYFLSILCWLIFISLLIPISTFTKYILQNRLVKFWDIFHFSFNDLIKSILINLVYLLVIVISIMNINFLKNYNKVIFTLFVVVNFWIFVFTLISYVWVLPVASHFEKNGPLKVIKKAFLVSFDNILYSILIIFLIAVSLVFLIFLFSYTLGYQSLIILSLFPGIAGLFLFLNLCFKHILKKY